MPMHCRGIRPMNSTNEETIVLSVTVEHLNDSCKKVTTRNAMSLTISKLMRTMKLVEGIHSDVYRHCRAYLTYVTRKGGRKPIMTSTTHHPSRTLSLYIVDVLQISLNKNLYVMTI
jgi:hypothetical protein